MIIHNIFKTAIILIIATGLTACTRVERDWTEGKPFYSKGEFLPVAPKQLPPNLPVVPIGLASNDQILEEERASKPKKMAILDYKRPEKEAHKVSSIDINPVYFEGNSNEIQPEMTETLMFLAKHLEENSHLRVEIQGKTDPLGTNEYNYHLGQKRAEKVKDYLVSLGIDPQRIFAVSYGEVVQQKKNVADSENHSNRRCDFYVF